tara:strand:- start:326 stop:1102 length:777 start_codon:yes stop_codon:yes gene_type:complete
MALTKIGTDSIKDDAITKAKIPADQIEASELANNAVDTNAIQDDAVTEDKLANSINTAIAANTAKDLTALSASNLTSGTIPDARFPATLPAVSGASLTNLPASGKILQVQSVTKTSVFTTTSGSFTDITGLSVSITPAASSKVLVLGACQYSSSGSGGNRQHIRLVRDSTAIAIGDAASNRSQSTFSSETSGGGGNMKNASLFYLDTHGANGSTAVTYKFQAGALDGGTFQLNQSVADTDISSYPRVASFLTVIEVAA